jgi:hypothetical protein
MNEKEFFIILGTHVNDLKYCNRFLCTHLWSKFISRRYIFACREINGAQYCYRIDHCNIWHLSLRVG